MFGLVMFLIFIILVLVIIYLFKKVLKIVSLTKINNKILLYLITLAPFLLLFILFNRVNFVVIILHLFIFISLSSLIFRLINKKYLLSSLPVIVGICVTIVYLGFGTYLDYHIKETVYNITTNKNIDGNFKILQITDTHVGTTLDGNGFRKHIEKISKKEADIVVITGDFVDDDTSREDMIISCAALSLFKPKYGVYFIYGNHDKGYFNYRNFNSNDLVKELEKNNVIVLKDEVKQVNDYIYLVGREDKTYQRKDIKELVRDIDKSKYIIDLNHQPNDYENEKNNVDLVLSGHTHGGQLLPLGYIGLLTHQNDEFYGLHKRGNTNFIVNSGMSDWAIDFKTGTSSEYVIINIHGE